MIRAIAFASTALVSLAAAGAAYAGDSTSNTYQDGYGHQVTVDQSGGDHNFVGSSSMAVQQNSGGYNEGQNYLSITQTGYSNSFGYEGYSGQSGRYNRNTVNQAGVYSSVEAVQNGDSNGVNVYGRGESRVTQNGSASFSDVNVMSNGTGNQFQIEQGGHDNRSVGTQDGTYHYLSINQGSSYGGQDNRIQSNQSGYQNQAFLLQGFNGNSSTVGQSNNYNTANVTQLSYNNVSTAYQSGGGNTATVNQGYYGGYGVGNGNISMLNQEASNGSATVLQSGSGGQSNLYQGGGSGSYAYVYQLGDGNSSTLNQVGYSHQATLNQVTASNISTINQAGTANYANIKQ